MKLNRAKTVANIQALINNIKPHHEDDAAAFEHADELTSVIRDVQANRSDYAVEVCAHSVGVSEALDYTDNGEQAAAHEAGASCDEEDCQDCCGEFVGHEHDSSEGGYCLQCGHHPHE